MSHQLDIYCSTTEFKSNLKRYKEAARSSVVHVLENGRSGYVLASVEMLEQLKESARRHAVWEVDVEDACWRSMRRQDEMPDGSHGLSVEYLADERAWHGSIAPSFDNDVRRRGLSDMGLDLIRQRLCLLADNPQVGLPVELGDVARIPDDVSVFRLDAEDYDIIYTIDSAGSVRVCGLVDTCEATA